MERIEINILDRHLTLSVSSEEKDKLLAAVEYADQLMQSIKESAPQLSLERIAIMASIKLSSDMMRMASSEGPFKGVQFGDFRSKINEINSILDSGMEDLKAV